MALPTTIGVTGAAGFIGSNLCDRLLASGCTVVGVDDLSAASMRNVASFADDPRFSLQRFDCRDTGRLARAFADCEAIVHLAAMKIPRYEGALRTLEVNVEGAHAAFEVGMLTGAHVVLASTSDVYGTATPPFAEDGEIVLGPPTTRRWAYAVSKLYDEHLALRLFEERELRVTILRLFNSYGPRNHPTWWGGPMSPFIENLLDGRSIELHGDGTQTRCFTYVSDTVDGFVRALERPETAGEVINIGSDRVTRIVDLATQVQHQLGIPGPLRATMLPFERLGGNYQDVRDRIPDTAKAERLLGFRASVELEDGLRETVAWHRLMRAEPAAPLQVAGVA